MNSILIAYATTEGQTARIAHYIAGVLQEQGCDAYPVDLERSCTPEPNAYDAVIVGASVHGGKHENAARDFVKAHRDVLERLPTAFFSVSLAAHDDTDQARKEVASYLEKFLRETGWHPDKLGAFPGALLYTRYNVIKRWIMRKIARDKGSRDTDTSRDYVYTDWTRVRRFAEEFLETLVPEGAGSAGG